MTENKATPKRRRPEWLQKRIDGDTQAHLASVIGYLQLNTICKEARCPNITECYKQKQATFLILGTICSRRCSFCNVSKATPSGIDLTEPDRVAEAVVRLGLRQVVITSPTRDDLTDGGAESFVNTILAIREKAPTTGIEILVPDFQGKREPILQTAAAQPNIYSHNLETVRRLYEIRMGADYDRSLALFDLIRQEYPELKLKSGIMLGLGEKEEEVLDLLRDLYQSGCRYLSIGQYLQPSLAHHPVVEYIHPDFFGKLRLEALSIGFIHVESAPYVRSSYHAENYVRI